MAYDEQLAERVRAQLAGEADLDERKMFGGLAFLLSGHIAVAVSGRGGLMARVDPAEGDALLDEPHVEPMVMAGRPAEGWLRVATAGVEDDAALRTWIARGVAVVRALPPKP